jgi:2-methylcitrate dehydratase PrpD
MWKGEEIQMDLISSLADHVGKIDFEALPRSVVEKTKLFILDSLGVALAGSQAPGVAQVAALMSEGRGKPESTVYYFGHRLSMMDAVLVNSMMVHALDFDDVHEDAVVHPGCVQVPVSFAVAEQLPSIVHGRDLIAAIALGTDVSCRLGLGLASGSGFVRSGTCGIFGAVVTAAKLRRCTKGEMVNALGIAFSQTAGNMQAVADGALVKRMQPGFMARNGIFSVLLAERGISGPANTMDGKYGFLELYKRGEVHREKITRALGAHYEVENVSVKPYPCGRFTHGAVEMAMAMAKEYNLEAGQISDITVLVNKKAQEYVGRPYDLNRGNLQVMAQFCIAYGVAAGIVRRDLFIGEFEEKVIKDPIIGQLALKVKSVLDESNAGSEGTGLVIKTEDGRSLSKRVEFPKGHPQNFLTEREFIGKFRKCADVGLPGLKKENVETVIDLVGRLETISDVRKIPPLLAKGNG